ncbi:uncharacterized protein Dvar_21240 [Desulfosarcina variabilis str. Montpellier]
MVGWDPDGVVFAAAGAFLGAAFFLGAALAPFAFAAAFLAGLAFAAGAAPLSDSMASTIFSTFATSEDKEVEIAKSSF